jgi:hypothetical protein
MAKPIPQEALAQHVGILTDGLTTAQRRALAELSAGAFQRTREGWRTKDGRFVPLIVVAKLRKRGLVILGAGKRTAKPTLAALPAIHALIATAPNSMSLMGDTQ